MLAHEYLHWARARTAAIASGDPEGGDPETSDGNVCGKCNHALMGVVDITRLWYACEQLSGEKRKRLCKDARHGIMKIEEWLRACEEAGCQQCCGGNDIPSADDIVAIPECCD